MKKYEQPAIELIKFSVMDVLQTSTFDTGAVVGDESKTDDQNFSEIIGF